MVYDKERFDDIFDSLNLSYDRKFDGKVSEVVVSTEAVPGLRGKGVAKLHPDDKEFGTELVGFNIAEIRANIEILKRLVDRKFFTKGAELTVIQGVNELEKLVSDYIAGKDQFYRKLEKNRAQGGREKTTFEDLGDLLKGVPQEKREEIFTQIYSSAKEERERIEKQIEAEAPKETK